VDTIKAAVVDDALVYELGAIKVRAAALVEVVLITELMELDSETDDPLKGPAMDSEDDRVTDPDTDNPPATVVRPSPRTVKTAWVDTAVFTSAVIKLKEVEELVRVETESTAEVGDDDV
jgi:hypothetical protein